MRTIYAVALLLWVVPACKPKNDPNTGEVEATFIGYDARMCACCGGQYLHIGTDTTRYRFLELPTPTGPPIDYGFAFRFWIRYKPFEGACRQSSPELITITSIRER